MGNLIYGLGLFFAGVASLSLTTDTMFGSFRNLWRSLRGGVWY